MASPRGGRCRRHRHSSSIIFLHFPPAIVGGFSYICEKDNAMETFLKIYYCLSVCYMIGYTDFRDLGFWKAIGTVFTILLCSPVILPFSIGKFIKKNS